MRTAPRTPRHHAPGTRKGWLGWFARIREFDDWRQVSTLRAVVPVILAAVSAYYLTRWAEANAMPWALAWTLPAALDVTAFMAVTVARRAADRAAKRKASALAWLCVILSVAGNIGSHTLDFSAHATTPLLQVSIWTIGATSMVYPLMLIAGHVVAGGMSARPLSRPQIDQAAAQIAAVAVAAQALARARAAEAVAQEVTRETGRRRPPARQAPARQAAPAPAKEAPATATAPMPTVPPPALVSAPTGGDGRRPTMHEVAVEYMRENPEHGRRRLLAHLKMLGHEITDHGVKEVHELAKEEAERQAAA